MFALAKQRPATRIVARVRHALVTGLLCALTTPALADVVVGNGAPGSCTTSALSTAIAAGNGTITFSCGGAPVTIPATGGGYSIPGGVQITIDGGNLVSLSGNFSSRILIIGSGATLTLKNLALTAALGSGDGGAIYNNGTLVVDHCQFTSNLTDSASSGGALVTYGPLTITNSLFQANGAGNGGAIDARWAGAVTTISDTTFDSNGAGSTANGWGGAILLWDGAPATLTRTTLTNNQTTQNGSGGAIYIQGSSILTIQDSQVTGNIAGYGGGAIYSEGTLTITGSTFQANRTGQSGTPQGGAVDVFKGAASIRSTLFKNNWAWYGGALALQGGTLTIADSWFDSNGYDQNNVFRTSSGGGIFINGGMASLVDVTLSGNRSISFGSGLAASSVLTMTNVTVSGNVSQSLYSGAVYLGGYSNNYFNNVTIAQNGGVPVGGIYIEPIAGLVMRNTIVADNTGANCNAPIPGSINNLSTDASCGFGAGRDSILIPLAPLANTGGFAPTHSPLAGSPAIDGGLAVYCPYTDQRGVVRAGKGATCDVGAVEYVGNGIGIDVDGNGTYDAATDGLLLLRYLFGLRGPALTNGAVGPGATRTGAQIEAYIQSLMQQ